jgi:Bacterial Ig-like domain
VTGSASTDTGGAGFARYEYRSSTDGGVSWSAPASGSSLMVSAEGETLVQFRGVDNAGNVSAWVPTELTAGATVRLDRTAPTAPTVSGGSLAWQNVASVGITGSGSTDAASGVSRYDYRTSTDNGVTWSAATAGPIATVSSEGQTLVHFRSVDGAGNMSAWTPVASTAGSTVRLDRVLPTAPTVSGGSLAWVNAASVTITGAGSTDSGSGLAGYQSRTSVDGGTTWSAASAMALPGTLAVSAPGQTLVQFRSVDAAGNVSSWMPVAPAAANTVRIDRTAPSIPAVSGGSLSWLTLASETISGSGSVDAGGAGFGHYEYQSSLDGGAWSAAVSGSSVIVSVEGTTIVQFRAVDAAGNASAWAPAVAGAGNTVKLDRTPPTLPTVSGGRSCTKRPVKVTGSGSTDGGSGINHYEYHVSTNGGVYAAPVTGTSVTFSTTGSYVVQFRVVDNAGNTTAWAPATAGAGKQRVHPLSGRYRVMRQSTRTWPSAAVVTARSVEPSGPSAAAAVDWPVRCTVAPTPAQRMTSPGSAVLGLSVPRRSGFMEMVRELTPARPPLSTAAA